MTRRSILTGAVRLATSLAVRLAVRLAAPLALVMLAALVAAFVAAFVPAPAGAQAWRESAAHLGTTARVLIIGTRPEDEDNALIAWLGLGRRVETAYLSLTRGESGVNVAGTERESALAVVRTAELLAERERDGAHQYFTRAYDFGSTRVDSIVDASWPHDSLLKDVVTVIRAFRPHILVSSSNAPGERDATRRLTAKLVAEAFAAAADTVRFPPAGTSRLPAWTVSRLFTRVDSLPTADAEAGAHVVTIDVGEFDRGAGRSYAELGAEIRQLQRSQRPQPAPGVGPLRRFLRLDSTRVGDGVPLFGSLDTTLSRFGGGVPAEAGAHLDTLRMELARAATLAASSAPGAGDSLAGALARVARRTSDVRLALPCNDVTGVPACGGTLGDLAVALNTIRERATRAMLDAAGLVITGTTARELVAAGDSVPVELSVYNGGSAPVVLRRLAASAGSVTTIALRESNVVVAPDSLVRRTATVHVRAPSYHWWQVYGMQDGTMLHEFRTTARNSIVPQLIAGEDRIFTSRVEATLAVAGVEVPVVERPLRFRGPTTVRSDVRHPLAGVPPTSVLLERTAEYERASQPIDRLYHVFVWSARSTSDTLAVMLRLPSGLRADSATRTVVLPPFGARNVFFRLRGTLRPATDTIFASAQSAAPGAPRQPAPGAVNPVAEYRLGIVTHEYPHIPTQQFIRFSNDRLQVVDVRVPPQLRVAYVRGADDDLPTPFGQLQVKLQALDPSLLSVVDLSAFSTVLIGAGALAGDAVTGALPALQHFLRGGGTIVVLPGGEEIARSGLLPYPLAFDSLPGRVDDPAARVQVTDARSPLLTWPNVVAPDDFMGWADERARGVPSAFDPRYRTVLSMSDVGQPPTAATILMARVGAGTIVYTSLSLDRQLAAVVPGAARLFVNLLAAGLRPASGR